MFDTLRSNTCTICNLDIAAYLLLMGCRLEGVSMIAKNRAAFTLTGRNVPQMIHDYKNNKRIKFAPKAYMDCRYDLKKMTPDPEEISEMIETSPQA